MATRAVTKEIYQGNLKKLKEKTEAKHGKTTEELYEEREKRLRDAIQLREPDRVPVVLGGPYFAARYAGLPYSSVYYDPIAWKEAYSQMMVDFEPDIYGTPGGATSSGDVLAALDAKNTLWPGGTLPPDVPHQVPEPAYMKDDEYDSFLADPTDFILRCYLPRVYGSLAPLAKLPTLTDRFTGFPAMTPVFTREEFRQAARALLKAGEEQSKWRQAMASFDEDMASLGFPPITHAAGAGGTPFDFLANQLRGWRGMATDMYKRPDKLLAACEKILELQMKRAAPADPKTRGNPKRAGGGGILTGADRFMTRKQFETFFMPTWKKAIEATIDLGFVPVLFAEGFCENRLDYFLQFPKGSLVVRLSDTDMARAKSALKDHVCIMGNVPLTLLQMGSQQEVEEYCRNLIQVCGKGGGFILRCNTDHIADAKPENLKAMVDSVKKYGWH